MNEQALRFRVGLFVLAALFLLAVLITLFGGVPSVLKRHDTYSIVFDNAPGVAPGTPVRRSGVRIGDVASVKLDDTTGKVRVGIRVEKPHPLFQRDVPTLVHGILSGDTAIDFTAQKREGEPVELAVLQPGSEIIGVTQAGVAALLNQAVEAVPTAQESLNQIRITLQRMEKMQPLFEETLKEYRDLAKASRETLPELRRTNEEVQVTARTWGKLGERLDVLVQTNQDKVVRTIENLNDTVERVGRVFNDENQRNVAAILKNAKTGSERFESITRNGDELLREGRGLVKESRDVVKKADESVARADRVLTNLERATQPLAERTGSVMKNLDDGTARLNAVLTEVYELVRAIGQGDGSLRRLLNDPTLYNNLNELTCGVTRLLPRVDHILRDLEVFADKIARHPESLGVGGAVNPSSGLKTVPSSNSVWPRPGHEPVGRFPR
jgi:phospholipid/cholesterol/gamma-HCH transport system substrate-binding protein